MGCLVGWWVGGLTDWLLFDRLVGCLIVFDCLVGLLFDTFIDCLIVLHCV